MQLVGRDYPAIKPGIRNVDGETERRGESVSCKPRSVAWPSRRRPISRQLAGVRDSAACRAIDQ